MLQLIREKEELCGSVFMCVNLMILFSDVCLIFLWRFIRILVEMLWKVGDVVKVYEDACFLKGKVSGKLFI